MPRDPASRELLCSDCKHLIGRLTGTTFRVRLRRGPLETFVPEDPPGGDLAVWCPKCRRLGALDVSTVIEAAKTRTKVMVELRWILSRPGFSGGSQLTRRR